MRARRGFTIVEIAVTLAVVATLASLALPALHFQAVRAGRAEAVQALTQLQAAQERHRSNFGRYAETLDALRVGADSAERQYRIALTSTGAESYLASASAREGARQARDRECRTLSLEVRQGFATLGPDGRCWSR